MFNMVRMLLDDFRKDDDIVYVDVSRMPLHGGEYKVYCTVQGVRRVLHSKQHPYKLVKSVTPTKGGIFVVSFVHFAFPVYGARILSWNNAYFFEHIDALFYSRAGIRVSNSYVVQLSIVDTKSEQGVLLRCKDGWPRLLGCCGFDNVFFQRSV